MGIRKTFFALIAAFGLLTGSFAVTAAPAEAQVSKAQRATDLFYIIGGIVVVGAIITALALSGGDDEPERPPVSP